MVTAFMTAATIKLVTTTSRHQSIIMAFDSLLVFAAVLQIIVCQEFSRGPPQGPPPGFPDHKCARPPPGVENPQACCQVKPLFAEEELVDCGFKKSDGGEEIRRRGPPDCSKQECLLNKRKLINENNAINYKAVEAFVDEWVQSNPEFKSPVDNVKSVCMGEGGPPGPPHICEANRLMFCTGAVIFSECPTWQDTDECKQLKAHMDECRGPNFPPPN